MCMSIGRPPKQTKEQERPVSPAWGDRPSPLRPVATAAGGPDAGTGHAAAAAAGAAGAAAAAGPHGEGAVGGDRGGGSAEAVAWRIGKDQNSAVGFQSALEHALLVTKTKEMHELHH